MRVRIGAASRRERAAAARSISAPTWLSSQMMAKISASPSDRSMADVA